EPRAPMQAPSVSLHAPTDNAKLRALLNGLSASPAPIPIDAATTDGDLAARYAAGPGAPAARHATPTPLPAVSFHQTLRIPLQPAAGGAPSPPGSAAPSLAERPAPHPARTPITLRIDRPRASEPRDDRARSTARRPLLLGIVIGIAIGGVLALAIAFGILRL